VVATVQSPESTSPKRSIAVRNQTVDGFQIRTSSLGATPENTDYTFSFTVHASSTVTPTYTWTRDGTTLKPANDGDSIEAGEATFAGTITGKQGFFANTDNNYAGLYIYGDQQTDKTETAIVVKPTAASADGMTVDYNGEVHVSSKLEIGDVANQQVGTEIYGNGAIRTYNSTSSNSFIQYGPGDEEQIVFTNTGSATFGDSVLSGESYDNVYLQGGNGDGSKPARFVVSARPGAFIASAAITVNTYPNIGTNATTAFQVAYNGTVTAPNVFFNLEADDDTKYISTTSEDGEQSLVYNGATLDVKALLLTLQTAATRIATLEAKVATLESDHTTLMNNNNNNNGGGY